MAPTKRFAVLSDSERRRKRAYAHRIPEDKTAAGIPLVEAARERRGFLVEEPSLKAQAEDFWLI